MRERGKMTGHGERVKTCQESTDELLISRSADGSIKDGRKTKDNYQRWKKNGRE